MRKFDFDWGIDVFFPASSKLKFKTQLIEHKIYWKETFLLK